MKMQLTRRISAGLGGRLDCTSGRRAFTLSFAFQGFFDGSLRLGKGGVTFLLNTWKYTKFTDEKKCVQADKEWLQLSTQFGTYKEKYWSRTIQLKHDFGKREMRLRERNSASSTIRLVSSGAMNV